MTKSGGNFFPDIFSGGGSQVDFLHNIMVDCSQLSWIDIWLAANIFILVTGAVANAALLCMFCMERRMLSASQVGSQFYNLNGCHKTSCFCRDATQRLKLRDLSLLFWSYGFISSLLY